MKLTPGTNYRKNVSQPKKREHNMRIDKPLLRIAIALVAVAAITSGCRSKPKNTGMSPNDFVTGPVIEGDSTFAEGDIPLDGSVRFETLERVTDAGEYAPVYFDYDAYNIPGGESMKISAVAELLKVNAAIVLVVEGHCDERGTNEYNMSLGEYRGQSVRDQLIALGIDGARIQTSSFGEERPADAGHDEGAWSRNRRAEFAFYRR